MDIGKGDTVRFTAMADPLNGDESPVMVEGTVFREPWGRAQNLSIRTTEATPRTFVRGPADVEIVRKAAS